jgi:hypothetical protein
MMRTVLARTAGLFRHARRDQALDQEVRAHLDLLAADYERRGMTPDEARYAARRCARFAFNPSRRCGASDATRRPTGLQESASLELFLSAGFVFKFDSTFERRRTQKRT